MITYETVTATADFLKNKGISRPEVGIILGTGLGGLAEHITTEIEVPYSEIPNFPLSTVETHSGKLIYGQLGGKTVIALKGRFHYYEGYSFQQITFPVRVLKVLGIQALLISNAAGNMNKSWNKGELMLLDDHINLLPGNPLIGKNMDEMGPRFPDMSAPYHPKLNNTLIEVAKQHEVTLRKGVYVAVSGPNLETRAEYRFLNRIGADAVGMSTVPECIVANQIGLPCCAISVLTDDCDPDRLAPVNISEIIAIASQAEKSLTLVYSKLIEQLRLPLANEATHN
jgi:purine-nucleoside phosphorylase